MERIDKDFWEYGGAFQLESKQLLNKEITFKMELLSTGGGKRAFSWKKQ